MMTRSRLILTLSVGVVFAYLTSFTPPSSAEIPQVISYQGKVTDTGGTPVADGNYTMRFRIYDDATSGTMEWDSGNQSIQVTGGIFDVLLGESPQPAISLPFDEDYWLLVTIAGDDQTPRQQLESVGYAYMASGLVPGTEINGSVASGTSAALKVVNTAPTGTRYGVYGQSTATEGWMYGIFGICASTIGRGVYGEASATSGNAFGVLGLSRSTIGRGVFGQALATTGQNYGVYGMTSSPTGYAGYFQGDAKVTGDLTVDGVLTASGLGDITAVSAGNGLDGGGTSGDVTLDVEVPLNINGSASSAAVINATNDATNGRGVWGYASATTGATVGVYGQSASNSGYGLYGSATATTGSNYGVRASSSSTSGRGVYGYASAVSGTNYGVEGRSASPSGRGVYGNANATSGTNYGVYGYTASPTGYAGYFQGDAKVTGDLAVDGTLDVAVPFSLTGSVVDNGVIHATNSASGGYGLYGEGSASAGISQGVRGLSVSTLGAGVVGLAHASSGETAGGFFRSLSTSGTGVRGEAYATSGTTYGVLGFSFSGSGYGVYYSNGLAGTGTKSCIVKTSQGPTLLYCQESPENWFEDFGEGQLVDGKAHIELDPLFLETVTIDEQNPMHVFIQPKGRCHGTFVETGATWFDVIEQEDGSSDISFSYRVVAKRQGFENRRLDYCAAAETDAYLYPELREKGLAELQE